MKNKDNVDIKDVIFFLNKTKQTFVDPLPENEDKQNWSTYSATDQSTLVKTNYKILYIYYDCPKKKIEDAMWNLRDVSLFFIVVPNKFKMNPLDFIDIYNKKVKTYSKFELTIDHIFTLKDFILKTIENPIKNYLDEIIKVGAGIEYYITPPLPRDIKTEKDLILSQDDDQKNQAYEYGLNVLLGGPGHGKTYLTKHLSSAISGLNKHKINCVPVLINSEQWRKMSLDDLKSVEKTILNSFKYHNSPIHWAENWENIFLELALKAGIFVIIFDGFDEYILRNNGNVSASETLIKLGELASRTNSDILITSRTTFWISGLDKINNLKFKLRIYKLLPFDDKKIKEYYSLRFHNKVDDKGKSITAKYIDAAIQIFNHLSESFKEKQIVDSKKIDKDSPKKPSPQLLAENPIGRGFILSMIADQVEVYKGEYPDFTNIPKEGYIKWIIKSLCTRERKRQDIELKPEEQILFFKKFAEHKAFGDPLTTFLLSHILEKLNDDGLIRKISKEEKYILLGEDEDPQSGRLKDHPLVCRDKANTELWNFSQDQIYFHFLSLLLQDYIAEILLNKNDNKDLYKKSKENFDNFINKGITSNLIATDIAICLVDQLKSKNDIDGALNSIKQIVRTLIIESSCSLDLPIKSDYSSLLASAIAIQSLEKFYTHDKHKVARATHFIDLLSDDNIISCIHFSGNITGLDLSDVTFMHCKFENVIWVNCIFNENTKFNNCSFINGNCIKSDTFGLSDFDESIFNKNSKYIITHSQIKCKKKNYTVDNLSEDIQIFVGLLIYGERGVSRILSRSEIDSSLLSNSIHYKKILRAFVETALDVEQIDGNEIYEINDAHIGAFTFCSENGIVTYGILKEIFYILSKRIGLLESHN